MNIAQINADLAATLAAGAVEGGVRHVVISPGSRSTPLVLAFAAAAERPRGPRLHVVLDERTAGFFALGLARASRTPVALVCTSGSAAAHWLPAVIEASEDRVPLLLLTADRPAEQHGCGAGQTVDQQRLFGGFARHFRDLGTPAGPGAATAYAALALATALDAARGSPPGPVHLNVPFREPLWSPGVEGVPARRLPAVERPAGGAFDATLWEPLVEALAEARRPVIVAGPLSPSLGGHLSVSLDLLAGHLGAPLLADVASQLRFVRPRRTEGARRGAHEALARVRTDVPEGNALASAEAILRTPAFTRRHVPDLVLRVGRMPASRTFQTWLAELPPETRFVHVDPQGDLHDPLHRADLVVAGDPRDLLRACAGLEIRSPVWPEPWRAADRAAQAVFGRACAEGFWAGGVSRLLAERLPEGAALHVASSMPIRDVDAFAAARAVDVPVFANRGANGIDGTVATALGLAAGREGRVVTLLGDLALLHDVGSLVAARELSLEAGAALTLVVVNNNGGGIFGFLPIAEHPTAFERCFRTPHSADFAEIARAAGVRHHRVFELDELQSALDRELGAPGVSLVECVVDAEADRLRHREAFAAAAAALSPQTTQPPQRQEFT